MSTCPKCSSSAIVDQRIDSDWHNSPATQVNDDSCYEVDDLKRLAGGRVQYGLSASICLKCNHVWDVSL